MGVPRERGRHIWRNKENFPNLIKTLIYNIQETQWTPSRINSKRPTPRYIIIKLSKDSILYLKTSKKDKSCHRQGIFKVNSYFSSETMEARRLWDNIFKLLKEKTVKQEFYIHQKMKKFRHSPRVDSSRATLPEILKGVLLAEMKGH